MFKERNQRGSAGNDLRRRNVHVLNAFRRGENRFAVVAGGNELLREAAVIIHLGVGLSDDVLAFLNSGKVVNFLRRNAVDNLAVRRFKEAVLIEARIKGERVNKADVRTFRRFNRADAAVVGRMHVAHFKAGALARQTTRTESGNTALMRDFRERVRLVHELRELTRTKELADRGRDGLRIDQILRRKAVAFGLVKAFLDGALNAHETGAELILGEFADAADAAVAEVVDVVDAVHRANTLFALFVDELDVVLAVAKRNEKRHRVNDVFLRKRAGAFGGGTAETGIDLHAANARQIVRISIKEEAVKERLNRFFRGRFARTHHAVDGNAGGELIRRVVKTQRVGNISAVIELIRKERLDLAHAGDAQVFERRFRDFLIGLSNDFARLRVDNVLRQNAPEEVVVGNGDRRHAGLRDVAQMLGSNALVMRNDDLAFAVRNVERHRLALKSFRDDRELGSALEKLEAVESKEAREDVLNRIADGLQEDRAGHLAAAVDAEVKDILGVEFKVKPRTTVGNNSSREEELARRMGLALVMLEEDAGRTVQLGNNDAFRAVHNERTLFRHQGDFAHVDVVLTDFLDRFRLSGFAIIDFKTDLGAKTRAVGKAAQLAFSHVEFRFGEVVASESQTGVTIVARDREDRSEGGLKAEIAAARSGLHVGLQEVFVRTKLNIKQGRHFKDARARGEALADALLFSERVRHVDSVRH